MNIIDEWNSLTTERQFEWLQADVLIAAREQIGNNAAWFLEYHGIAHLTATAWNIAFEERMNERYISGRNANRETQISLNSIVYGCAKDAIRREAGADGKHSHADLEDAENGMSAQRTRTPDRITEDRVFMREWLNELFAGLDDIDTQIVKNRLNGKQQNEIAQIIGISPAAICKRMKRIRATLTAANT